MAAVVARTKLEPLIEPRYPKFCLQRGRKPFRLPTMLRIYGPQQGYGLSDPSAEDALYDIPSIRR
jgi:IS5 family transposase